ncbi:MAG: hypothetical protein RDV48_12605 [Candidatus Eremiobacteraeota bacterium]|nr:hypothetical protein [Candidatus Eremiobacteraeota bacterium]
MPAAKKRLFLLGFLCGAVFLLMTAGCLYADSYYPNSGVDTTDDAFPLTPHSTQWMIDYEWDQYIDASPMGMPVFEWKYGISDRLDCGIQVPYLMAPCAQPDSVYGFTDIGFGFKYLWTPVKPGRIMVATIASCKPQTTDSESYLGSGATDYDAHLVLSYVKEPFRYHLNYGYTFWGELPGIPQVPSPFYKAKIDYTMSPQFSWSAEVYGEDSQNPDFFLSTLQSTIKTTWQVNSKLALDFGMAFGLNTQSPLRRYLFSITYGP